MTEPDRTGRTPMSSPASGQTTRATDPGPRRAPAAITHLVRVDGHALAVTVRGTPRPGTPAVVIVAGAGDCQVSWAPVATRLADHTSVITYDRAGIGRSRRRRPGRNRRGGGGRGRPGVAVDDSPRQPDGD